VVQPEYVSNAVADVRDDPVAQVAEAEDDPAHPAIVEQLELIVDERTTGERDERLRQVGREGAEPVALPPARMATGTSARFTG
jgi:hypothetical protein